jgi:hypothetical protein
MMIDTPEEFGNAECRVMQVAIAVGADARAASKPARSAVALLLPVLLAGRIRRWSIYSNQATGTSGIGPFRVPGHHPYPGLMTVPGED